MSRSDEPLEEINPQEDDQFVPAVFARSPDDAEVYRELLSDHGIPAVVGDEEEDLDAASGAARGGLTRGVPILVPEAMLDEASEVIADRENADEFAIEEVDEAEDEETDDDTFMLSDDLIDEELEELDELDDDEEDEDDDEDDGFFLDFDDDEDLEDEDDEV